MKSWAIGLKITAVRRATKREMETCGFDYGSSLAIVLSDGSVIIPMGDEEGNMPGEFTAIAPDGKNVYLTNPQEG
jgi:hypothetical protein